MSRGGELLVEPYVTDELGGRVEDRRAFCAVEVMMRVKDVADLAPWKPAAELLLQPHRRRTVERVNEQDPFRCYEEHRVLTTVAQNVQVVSKPRNLAISGVGRRGLLRERRVGRSAVREQPHQ